MPASNHNCVCFRCRTSIRTPKYGACLPKCLTCGTECFNLGYKVEIPKQTDVKAWRLLETECRRRDTAMAEAHALRRVQRQHFLEREIRRLRELPENRDRTRRINLLAKELARLTEKPGESAPGE